jgi:enoyl-CoA hydratase/carnithine racemase
MTTLGNALYMQLTGNRVSAGDALRMGLIQEVLPDREALMERAEKLAGDIQLNAPLAVQAIKRIVMTGKNMPIEYAQKLSVDAGKLIQQTEDSVEGPKAFAEKRPPVWKMG